MRITPTEDAKNHRVDIWKKIQWNMNAHKVEPKELARRTSYPLDFIVKGIRGEPVPITQPFLAACVKVFTLAGGRDYQNVIENKPESELEDMLGPEPSMPPRPGNFWEWKD